MIIGIPKEIKGDESRVGLTETGVSLLVQNGHRVFVEKHAGVASGITDEVYVNAGAKILDSKEKLYNSSDMIIKVKEPQPSEYPFLKENQILYCYLHLANEPELTQVLCERKVSSVAYETIEDENGKTQLLVPMSEVAGKMATQIGAQLLQKNMGGKGILLGGSIGLNRARVVILGAGIVGFNALKIAVGMGAEVTILDINRDRLEYLDHIYGERILTLYSNQKNITVATKSADLLIGAVLITGHKAPKLITKEMVGAMGAGSVVVDVAVDQGGCIETCKPTSHEDPTFTYHGVTHYCVPNMPGIVPRTSTYALTGVTISYGLLLANNGVKKAIELDSKLEKGLNTYRGNLTYKPVADALNMNYKKYKDN